MLVSMSTLEDYLEGCDGYIKSGICLHLQSKNRLCLKIQISSYNRCGRPTENHPAGCDDFEMRYVIVCMGAFRRYSTLSICSCKQQVLIGCHFYNFVSHQLVFNLPWLIETLFSFPFFQLIANFQHAVSVKQDRN